MAFEKVSIGTAANDGTGSSPRKVGEIINTIVDFLNGSYSDHFTTHNSDIVATENQFLFIDTSSNDVTVTLPTIVSLTLPDVGVSITIVDVAGTFDTNQCNVITTDGALINRVISPYVNNVKDNTLKLVYSGTTFGWVIT